MISQFIHSFVFLLLVYVLLYNNADLAVRTAMVVLLSTMLFTANRIINKANKVSLVVTWLSRKKPVIQAVILSFGLLLVSLTIQNNTPNSGITLRYLTEENGSGSVESLSLNKFIVHPPLIPYSIIASGVKSFSLSAFFRTNDPIRALSLSVSQGEAEWFLDGEKIASMSDEVNAHYFFSYTDIPAGVHKLECNVTSILAFPSVSANYALGQEQEWKPVSGPFLDKPDKELFPVYAIGTLISELAFIMSLLLLVPTLNSFLGFLFSHINQYQNTLSYIMIACLYGFLILFTFPVSILHDVTFEADEAAFGLLSQLLLEGQSPPMFHYGQSYQGTWESYVLSFLASFSLSPALTLKILPALWFLVFLLFTSLTFWRFGNLKLLCLFLLFSIFGGIHFHWIFSKSWFGYSFSLACGSIMMYLAILTLHRRYLSSGTAFLLGAVSGLSLYELPVGLPFFLISFLIVFTVLISAPDQTGFQLSRLLNLKHLIKSNAAILFFSLFLFCSPYLISGVIENEFSSVSFLFEGRNLPPARILQENPLINRTINECLPVLSGVRFPYYQQENLPSVPFSGFPSQMYLLSIIIAPFLINIIKSENNILFSNKLVFYSSISISVLTILIPSLSSFGIWPWYLISLYWSIPFLLYCLLRSIWTISPSSSVLVAGLFFLPLYSAQRETNPFLNQPTSTSLEGLPVPTDFKDLESFLKSRHIDYVLSDQGYDTGLYESGRDWIGECLTYNSNGDVISIGRLSRRIESYGNQLMQANRLGYLFHKNFFYNKPNPSDPENYLSFSSRNIERLFSGDFLDFERKDFDPYVVFVPKTGINQIKKQDWIIKSSWPYFLQALNDHNISTREFGFESYWSSDDIPEEGVRLNFKFREPIDVQRIVLFHGSKADDFPRKNIVMGTDLGGKDWELGSLTYDRAARASKLDLNEKVTLKEITLHAFSGEEDNWLTIYELWFLPEISNIAAN